MSRASYTHWKLKERLSTTERVIGVHAVIGSQICYVALIFTFHSPLFDLATEIVIVRKLGYLWNIDQS